MKRTVFIVNPAAGHGRAANFWRRVEPLVRECFPGYKMRWTLGPRRAKELLAQELQDGPADFIAVGGDGTLNELADALLALEPAKREGSAVGVLPAGSGCDFARHHGIPRDPRVLLPLLARGRHAAIDAAHARWTSLGGGAEEAHWTNIAALGIAGDIAHAMLRSGKPLGGTVSYLAASLKAIFGSKAKRMRLTLDGEVREGSFHLAALANTKSTGGGMLIAPEASSEDGRLDLILVHDLSRTRLLWNFPKIYAGSHLGVPGIEHLRVSSVKVESEEEVLLNLDGEAAGRAPGSFEVLPGALPVLLPAASFVISSSEPIAAAKEP